MAQLVSVRRVHRAIAMSYVLVMALVTASRSWWVLTIRTFTACGTKTSPWVATATLGILALIAL
jgi:hypothetical protein